MPTPRIANAPANLRELTAAFPYAGQLDAILLRPQRGAAARQVDSAQALAGCGLVGDRSAAGKPVANMPGSKRQVTLLQAEHLPVIAALLRRTQIDPLIMRRNLVVSGLNLLAVKALFKDQPMRLVFQAVQGDDVVLEVTGPCEPCSKMEAALGHGAYNVLRGHGGLTARVLVGGTLMVGTAVRCEVAVQAN
jgi:MOSC domain-containing protein YiiM